MSTFLNDFKYASRQLRKSPGFSVAVVVTMALCIGANTTVFSALYGLVLKPLPFDEPEQLVQVFNTGRNNPLGSHKSGSSWKQYLDIRERTDLFTAAGVAKPWTNVILHDDVGVRIKGRAISADFFDLLRVRPLLGRFFVPEEVGQEAHPVAVLTQTAWETDYLANPNVIGQPIHFAKGRPLTIVGVAPRSVEVFDRDTKVFTPYNIRPHAGRYGDGADLWVRLNGSVSREAANEQLQAMERQWYEERADAEGRAHYDGVFERIALGLPHPLKGSLSLLQGAALFVLLIGCLNVVTLLLHRAGHMAQELSIRNALGAGKSDLCRLKLMESALLCVLALALGMTLALGGLSVINRYLGALDSSAVPIVWDIHVVGSILAITVGVMLVMGLLPMELLWRTGLLQQASSGRRTASAGVFSRRLSNGLVVGQVAVASALLIGAGLLFRSFRNVLAVDPGFDSSRVVKGRIDDEPVGQYAETAALKQRIVAEMQAIPGVRSVSLAQYESFMPHNGENTREFVTGGATGQAIQSVARHLVSPEYFTTMGMTLLEGRTFRPGDNKDDVYVVDELYARRAFPDGRALGAEIFWDKQAPPAGVPWCRVIGVVARANLRGLEQRDGLPVVYTVMNAQQSSWSFTVLLRSDRPSDAVIKDMRATLHKIDPRIPLVKVSSLQSSLDDMVLGRRGVALLFGAFAGLSLLLSLVGIYAVLAYNVLQRRQEIGIRAAIGASRWQVMAMVLRQGVWKAGLGLGLGLTGSLYLTRFLESQLFDITKLDPGTYLGAFGLLLFAALLASWLPARRAVKVDPMEALRHE